MNTLPTNKAYTPPSNRAKQLFRKKGKKLALLKHPKRGCATVKTPKILCEYRCTYDF